MKTDPRNDLTVLLTAPQDFLLSSTSSSQKKKKTIAKKDLILVGKREQSVISIPFANIFSVFSFGAQDDGPTRQHPRKFD